MLLRGLAPHAMCNPGGMATNPTGVARFSSRVWCKTAIRNFRGAYFAALATTTTRTRYCQRQPFVMPPAKKPRWEVRPERNQSKEQEELVEETPPAPIVRTPTMSAVERRQLFARLLWLFDYRLIFAAEGAANAPMMQLLKSSYTSAHTRRLMQLDTAEGHRAVEAVEGRLGDCIGFLDRARNRLHVPVSQAAKAIVFLASCVKSIFGRRSAKNFALLGASMRWTC